jgi:hypothetical protein
MIWFGYMSDISQLASRVGGGGLRGSGVVFSPYHYTTWLRERGRVQGGELRSLGVERRVRAGDSTVLQCVATDLVWPNLCIFNRISCGGRSGSACGKRCPVRCSIWYLHRKKKDREFPVPSRDVTTKLSLGGNNDVITELFLPRGSLVSDISAGDGKLVNLFLRCTCHERLRSLPLVPAIQ